MAARGELDTYQAMRNFGVTPEPKGRKVNDAELHQITEDCSKAMSKLAAFYADPSKVDTAELMQLLQRHLEQVAFQHQNVGQYIAPQLEL